MSIPRDTIEIIRERSHIEEIVKKYVPTLKKRGNNYVGLCPFHREKTPSFTVSPDKKIFYCFGCHTGGSVFTFISKIERLTFPESVRFLGRMLGMDIRETGDDENTRRETERLFRVNQYAMQHFTKVLDADKGKEGRVYLMKRGLSENSISTFKLGYAPEEWDSLHRYLTASKIPLQYAEKLGLLAKSEKSGKLYDRFRGRIIFPIFNQHNNVLAFGGRITGKGEPKYLNSPESDIFKKGYVLYGLNLARPQIEDTKRAIVVEGYLDVIGCHQNGILNVVAPLGTALTANQVKILARYCREIILLFDADSAGINASLRSLEVIKDVNVDVRVAVLPEGDPFDYITTKGPREFMAIVDAALKPVDFKLKRIVATSTGKSRIGVLMEAFEAIREIEYETERSHYLKVLSSLLNTGEKEIRADFKNYIGGRKEQARADILQSGKSDDGIEAYPYKIFRELVLLLCHYPELLEQALFDITEEIIPDGIARNIFSLLRNVYASGEKVTLDRIIDHFPEGSEKEFLENNLFWEYTIESPKAAYTEIYINLRLFLIDQKINKYADELKKKDKPRDSDAKDYLTEIEILRREKEKLSSYLYNKQII